MTIATLLALPEEREAAELPSYGELIELLAEAAGELRNVDPGNAVAKKIWTVVRAWDRRGK